MAAINAPQGNIFAGYAQLNWKQQVGGAAGIVAFLANTLYKYGAFKSLYAGVQPSVLREGGALAAGEALGLQSFLIALVVSAVVYQFLNCLFPERGRPHQQ